MKYIPHKRKRLNNKLLLSLGQIFYRSNLLKSRNVLNNVQTMDESYIQTDTV
jgi:hypothetical protein